jgi:hypothetical protein
VFNTPKTPYSATKTLINVYDSTHKRTLLFGYGLRDIYFQKSIIFRSKSFKKLAKGTQAEVIDLALAGFDWDLFAMLDPR